MSKRHRHFLEYESRGQPLLSGSEFGVRLLVAFGTATLLMGGALGVGMLGYWHFESMSWIDAFVNASMILSGMGPIGELKTFSGKLFAGSYALFSALVLILAAGLILAPIAHRVMHRFHLEDEENPGS